MEFIGGIVFTLVVEFIGYKVWKALERRRAIRETYIPPKRTSARPRDYLDNGRKS